MPDLIPTPPDAELLPPVCRSPHPRITDASCSRPADHTGSHQDGDRVWRAVNVSPDPFARVAGYCPACGGASLFLAAGGHVTCSRQECPRPTAVDELLDDRETEHVVQLGEKDFTVRHPLRERLDDDLYDCELHKRIAALDGPPRTPGRYRVRLDGDQWFWLAAGPSQSEVAELLAAAESFERLGCLMADVDTPAVRAVVEPLMGQPISAAVAALRAAAGEGRSS